MADLEKSCQRVTSPPPHPPPHGHILTTAAPGPPDAHQKCVGHPSGIRPRWNTWLTDRPDLPPPPAPALVSSGAPWGCLQGTPGLTSHHVPRRSSETRFPAPQPPGLGSSHFYKAFRAPGIGTGTDRGPTAADRVGDSRRNWEGPCGVAEVSQKISPGGSFLYGVTLSLGASVSGSARMPPHSFINTRASPLSPAISMPTALRTDLFPEL